MAVAVGHELAAVVRRQPVTLGDGMEIVVDQQVDALEAAVAQHLEIALLGIAHHHGRLAAGKDRARQPLDRPAGLGIAADQVGQGIAEIERHGRQRLVQACAVDQALAEPRPDHAPHDFGK